MPPFNQARLFAPRVGRHQKSVDSAIIRYSSPRWRCRLEFPCRLLLPSYTRRTPASAISTAISGSHFSLCPFTRSLKCGHHDKLVWGFKLVYFLSLFPTGSVSTLPSFIQVLRAVTTHYLTLAFSLVRASRPISIIISQPTRPRRDSPN